MPKWQKHGAILNEQNCNKKIFLLINFEDFSEKNH